MNLRQSRCLDPGNAPQEYFWAVIDGDPKAVAKELAAAIRAAVPAEQVVNVAADVNALLERIARCEAVQPDDVKPVTRHDHMYEFKVDDQASGVHLRLYCAEVPELPRHVVVLRVHQKVVEGDDEAIRKQQNAEIDVAIRRLDLGRRTFWGMP